MTTSRTAEVQPARRMSDDVTVGGKADQLTPPSEEEHRTDAGAAVGARAELGLAERRAFCAGDQRALALVFDVYSRQVWSVAMSVLRNRELADDATQETFMRAWRSANQFDPERSMAPWLMTIARRTALDVLRRENRPTRGGHEPEQDVVINLPGIERAWETWEIRAALDQLPDEEREVVFYAHFHGLTHQQIAEHLGVPVGTVKSRSFRAHKRLAALLEHVVNAEGEAS